MLKSISLFNSLIRIRHWIKNILVFAPLFFAGQSISATEIRQGIILFASFSSIASSVYIFNDLIDAPIDRLHPVKKNRPIASKQISSHNAKLVLIFFLILTLLLGKFLPLKIIYILLLYLIINVLYSAWLKKLVIIDIFIVAIMYLLRIYSGSLLWHIPLSNWIILCTFFGALFLISAKRRSELNSTETRDGSSRTVIKYYNKEFLDHLLTITLTTTMLSYSMYVVFSSNAYMFFSLLFVTFGLLRYLYLIYDKNIGQTPEDILFKDAFICGSVIFWLIYNGIIIYMI